MAAGRKTGGRAVGSPNKATAAFKDAVELAAAELGGTARLVEWAKLDPKNEFAFWTVVFPKLAPLQVNLQGNVYVSISGTSANL